MGADQMELIYTGNEIKEMDRQETKGGTEILSLVEKAGEAIAAQIEQMPQGPICIFCGAGNNGADGLSAALLLARTRKVSVLFFHEHAVNSMMRSLYEAVVQSGIESWEIENEAQIPEQLTVEQGIVVDALLGAGSNRPVQGLLAKAIEKINVLKSKAMVISIDIPTGVFPDTGTVKGPAVCADITYSLMGHKPGVLLYPGAKHAGRVVLLHPFQTQYRAPRLRFVVQPEAFPNLKRDRFSHKGTYGQLAIVVGSDGMYGAGELCARAALRSGVGILRMASPQATATGYRNNLPCALVRTLPEENGGYAPCRKDLETHFEGATALAVGCGMGKSKGVWPVVFQALQTKKPCVVDADALNALARAGKQAWPYLHEEAILTPHPAELARLLQTDTSVVLMDAMRAAEALAMSTSAVVLCKNASTIIAGPKYTAVVTRGCAGMAKGGSGDVLAGCMGSLLAQGYSAFDSACMAAYICGRAGELAQEAYGDVSMLPTDTIEMLPRVFMELEK